MSLDDDYPNVMGEWTLIMGVSSCLFKDIVGLI